MPRYVIVSFDTGYELILKYSGGLLEYGPRGKSVDFPLLIFNPEIEENLARVLSISTND